MDSSIIFIGTGILVITALVLSIAITIVAQIFHVEINPKIEEIYEILPHLNCGACGYPGCHPYAEGVINDGDVHTKCRPGKEAVAQKILDILNK